MKFALALILACLTESFAVTSADPSFVVHILGYVRKDYGAAVGANGKILSKPEYSEQIDFVKAALDTAKNLPELYKDKELMTKLDQLRVAVDQKKAPDAIAALCADSQAKVMKLAKLETSPLRWPNRAHGKQLFQQNCATCHGANGHGDGPSGTNLDPKPTDFHDVKMAEATSYETFNTIKLGVPGTGMASFSSLPENELWDLAFYVMSLRHEAKGTALAQAPAGVSLVDIANTSDEAFLAKLPGDPAKKAALLTQIRLYVPTEPGAATSVALAVEKLNEALAQLKSGDLKGAKQSAVMAYLDGVEPIEPALRVKNADLVLDIEQKMSDVRSAIDAGYDSDTLTGRVQLTIQALRQAEEELAKKGMSPSLTFSVAAGIFLREAFEAILIIITLLGVIRSIGSSKAAAYVHGGWILAVGLGLVGWVFSGWIMTMSGANRELLEGSIALFAVVVLLYFGFWLHRRTEIGKWRAFLDDMVKTAIDGKNLIALGVVSFMAVFREAFETVLFLRALLLESPGQEAAMAAGVLVSFVFVLLLAAALVRFSVRIPIRQLFGISSLIMALLSLILIGKAAHSFQETGLLSITQLPTRLQIDLIGFYPTYETLIPQVAVLTICAGLWLWGRRSSQWKEQPV